MLSSLIFVSQGFLKVLQEMLKVLNVKKFLQEMTFTKWDIFHN